MMKALLLMSILVAPSAAATWYAHGTHEPDSAYDLQYGQPWLTSPGRETSRVYFNGFIQQASGLNPNVGTLATRFETNTLEYHVIMVGRWIDCNGDGYVGSAQTGLREYADIELVVDRTLCPSETGPVGSWSRQSNYNGWVTEFIPIAPASGMDERVFVDQGSSFWADHGLPSAPPIARASCAAIVPREGARSTGALIAHADCLADVASEGHTDAITAFAGLGDLGEIAFPEEITIGELPESIETIKLSPGNAEDEESFVTIHDCGDPYIFHPLELPYVDGGPEVYVYSPTDAHQPHVNTEGGSVAGTYAYAAEIAGFGSGAGKGPCDGNSEDPIFYDVLEGSSFDAAEGIRRSSDILFEFHDQPRGSGAPYIAGYDPPTDQVSGLAWEGDAGAAPDLGIPALAAACDLARCKPSGWYSEPRIRSAATLLTTRLDINAPGADLNVARITTYYGNVNSLGFLNVPRSEGTYGSGVWPACHEVGWECYTSKWYPDLDANDPLRESLPMIYDSYNVIDVDCLDGGIRDTSLALGVPQYGPQPCPPPPYDELLSQLT